MFLTALRTYGAHPEDNAGGFTLLGEENYEKGDNPSGLDIPDLGL
jgi:hypothetical protein